MIKHENLGGSEDWSARYTNQRTRKSLCIIDTGGTYDIVADFVQYQRGAEAIANFENHADAVVFVTRKLKG
jgi:predicted GTPase